MARLASATAWPVAARAQVGAGMTGPQLVLAARNNAIWCDAICRAHELPGEFHDGYWLTRRGTPRFYPDVVTTAGAEAAPAQIAAITDLVHSNRQRDWFVKDSFNCLRLETLGFRPLLDAEWIVASSAGPDTASQPAQPPAVVRDEAALRAWELSWARAGGATAPDALPRVFKPALLADADIRFVSIQGERADSGGGILNRGAGVVGVSNVFGTRLDRVWRDLITCAGETFPGLPLIGYEHGDDLSVAKAAGFAPIGTLRIWRLGRAH
ncbi:MAG: hypothetical protein EKK41_20665 [Hyphomicrobiales bacterium]|nr:MAG: hypothetical protein EKK41_20665 [Hyphomicrobiales bacterium]